MSKQNLLFELADAALTYPEGIVREVVYPVVGEQTLRDLVKEWKATGPTYRTTLRTVIRNSYSGHYRRMVPQLTNIWRRWVLRARFGHYASRPIGKRAVAGGLGLILWCISKCSW